MLLPEKWSVLGRGADLRIGTAFRHNEHIDTTSQNPELVRELQELRRSFGTVPALQGIDQVDQPVRATMTSGRHVHGVAAALAAQSLDP